MRASFNDEGNIELSIAAYDHTLVQTFPPKMVETYKEYESKKANEQNQAEIVKLDEQHAKLLASLTAQETNRANVLNKFDAETLANRIVELKTVPRELEFLRSKLVLYEAIRLKLQNSLKLSDSERISLLSGFRDEVGDVGSPFIEIDDRTKQSLSPAARPANGTVIVTSNYPRANQGEELERKRLTLERTIKENELNTELAVQQKKRQIRESEMEADIAVEHQRATLVDSRVANERKEAEARAAALQAMLEPIKSVDWRTLVAVNGADSAQVMSLAFQELAQNAAKIGELNITPDLLNSLLKPKK